jgi:hypothetical protein
MTSSCLWIKVEILGLLFLPLGVMAVAALLNRCFTMAAERHGRLQEPPR